MEGVMLTAKPRLITAAFSSFFSFFLTPTVSYSNIHTKERKLRAQCALGAPDCVLDYDGIKKKGRRRHLCHCSLFDQLKYEKMVVKEIQVAA